MSKNNQILIKEHKGKYLVFDVMAESWGGFNNEPLNRLNINKAKGSFDRVSEANDFANKLEREDEWGGSEYGIVYDVLWKDDAQVEVVDDDN